MINDFLLITLPNAINYSFKIVIRVLTSKISFDCSSVDGCDLNPCDTTNGGCTNDGESFVCYCNDGWQPDSATTCAGKIKISV